MAALRTQEIEKLIELVGADVYRFCLRMTQCQADAEDLYQQTFLKLCEMKKEIDWADNPRSFVLSVAALTEKSNRRRYARRQRLAPQVGIPEDFDLAEDTFSTEGIILNKEEQLAVRRAVNALEERLKTSVVLYYTLEMPVEEIAETLNIPVGTVKSRLYKAQKTDETIGGMGICRIGKKNWNKCSGNRLKHKRLLPNSFRQKSSVL